jgi:[acyl-carrier-protein] S-malonyltransferase
MTPVAFLFAGQGAQRVGMGKDLAQLPVCARLFELADAALGYSLTQIMFEGPEAELTLTKHCQPALYIHGLACMAAFQKEAALAPTHTAGLSLGEFTAHAVAGTFSIDDGLRIVAKRGAAMQEACDASRGGMAALLGADEAQATQLAQQADVDVANFNCPGQVVLSGAAEHIERLPELAKAVGVKRATALKVAGAYHSRLMQPAADKLRTAIAGVPFQAPRIPVIANFTALPATDVTTIQEVLVRQVTGAVRFEQSIRYLAGLGVKHFIEFGPGAVLCGFLKRIDPALQTVCVGEAAHVAPALDWARSHALIA